MPAGGSLLSGGGSSLVNTGGKKGVQPQIIGGSIGPGQVPVGGGQGSAGSGSLVSGTPGTVTGSVASGAAQGFQQTPQLQQLGSQDAMAAAGLTTQRSGGPHSAQMMGISAVGQSGVPGRSYGVDELDVMVVSVCL